jgi:hypothetical protein
MLDTSRDALVESTSEVERLAALVEVLLASRDAQRADNRSGACPGCSTWS